jgi:hypothetical protein
MSNRSVAQALNLPLRVVEHIFESFKYNGMIKYGESIGGGRFRCELRRQA